MKTTAIVSTSLFALALAACGDEGDRDSAETMPQPREDSAQGVAMNDQDTPVHAAEAPGHADVGDLRGAPFMLDFTEGAGPEPFQVPEGLSWQSNGEGYILSGDLEDTPHSDGFTGGVVFEIPTETATRLSTLTVEVVIVASAEGGAEFAAAYSNNDGADSGWQSFEVDESPDHVRFEWTVPTVETGSGDYIGLFPSGGQPVTIHAIAARPVVE